MTRSFLLVPFVLALVASIPLLGAKAPRLPPDDPNAMTMEVAALQTLRDLDLSPSQLDALGKIVQETPVEDRKRKPAKVSAAYRNALRSLREALRKADEQHASQFREKLDELQEKEEPVLDSECEISTEARKQAAAALRLLSVRQLGILVGSLDLTDPAELLVAGVESVRGLKSQEKDEEVKRLADEVAWVVAGADEDAAAKVRENASKLLERAAAIASQQQFKLQQRALEGEARQVVGNVDNMTMLGHSLEYGMAELLSNPRLDSAIRAARSARPASRSDTKNTTPKGKGR
jgi:molybdenum-dependent DNA-binding transcriptional regulator ModE